MLAKLIQHRLHGEVPYETAHDHCYFIPNADCSARRAVLPRTDIPSVVAALAVGGTYEVASGADARSTPPAWSWATQSFTMPLRVDTANCTSIRVPVGGALVEAAAAGELCSEQHGRAWLHIQQTNHAGAHNAAIHPGRSALQFSATKYVGHGGESRDRTSVSALSKRLA